jgi:hypothetical protein
MYIILLHAGPVLGSARDEDTGLWGNPSYPKLNNASCVEEDDDEEGWMERQKRRGEEDKPVWVPGRGLAGTRIRPGPGPRINRVRPGRAQRGMQGEETEMNWWLSWATVPCLSLAVVDIASSQALV